MAVKEEMRGKQIGLTLAQTAIDVARKRKGQKMILYSNTLLDRAIALYRNLGFWEVPLDGSYKRSNIKLEYHLDTDFNLSLTEGKPAHALALSHLAQQTFTETFAAYNSQENMDAYLKKQLLPHLLEEELKDPLQVYFLAFCKEALIGYAKIKKSKPPSGINFTPTLELQRLYVLKAWKGKSIGSRLLSECFHYGRRQHYKSIWLGVWENNHEARNFYEKWKFIPFGDCVFLLGDDPQKDLLLERRIF